MHQLVLTGNSPRATCENVRRRQTAEAWLPYFTPCGLIILVSEHVLQTGELEFVDPHIVVMIYSWNTVSIMLHWIITQIVHTDSHTPTSAEQFFPQMSSSHVHVANTQFVKHYVPINQQRAGSAGVVFFSTLHSPRQVFISWCLRSFPVSLTTVHPSVVWTKDRCWCQVREHCLAVFNKWIQRFKRNYQTYNISSLFSAYSSVLGR